MPAAALRTVFFLLGLLLPDVAAGRARMVACQTT